MEKALEDDPKAGDMATDAFEKIAGIMKSVPRLYANVPLAYQKLQKAYAYHKAQGKKKK